MEKGLNNCAAHSDEFVTASGESILIREAAAGDAAAMAKINVSTWRHSYQLFLPPALMEEVSHSQKQAEIEDFFSRLDKNQGMALVAVKPDGEMTAFIMAGKSRPENPEYAGEIYNLHVAPAYQGQSIGRRLISMVSQVFRQRNWSSMMVWTLAENPSRRFYEKLGGLIITSSVDEYRGFRAPVIAYGWKDLSAL